MQRMMMMVMSYAVCCATNLAPPTTAQIRYIVGCVNGPLFSHRLPAFKSGHHATPRRRETLAKQGKAVYWAGAAASPSIKTSFHIWAGWMMDLGFLERMRLSPPTDSLVQSWQPLSSFVELLLRMESSTSRRCRAGNFCERRAGRGRVRSQFGRKARTRLKGLH